MKCVKQKPDVFVAKDENPMDVLGVGANMAKAIRYWLQATKGKEPTIAQQRKIGYFCEYGICLY